MFNEEVPKLFEKRSQEEGVLTLLGVDDAMQLGVSELLAVHAQVLIHERLALGH